MSIRKIFNVWTGVALLGLIMVTGGGIQIVAFLNKVPMYKTITLKQQVQELIIPHIAMLFGMGIVTTGLIFMVRRGVIQTRMQNKDV